MGLFSFLQRDKIDVVKPNERELLTVLRAKGINTPDNLWDYLMPDYTSTGKMTTATKKSSLTLSAVYNALNISSNSINLPINVKKRTSNGSELVTIADRYEFQVHKLLHTSPNLKNTPSELIQLLEWARLIYGNGYAEIVRDGTTKPIALVWLHPETVKVNDGKTELYYTIEGTTKTIRSMDMIHVKAASFDGIKGISPIDLAAESLGFGLATQRQGNKYYDAGMTNKVVLSHPGELGADGSKNLKDSFDKEIKSGNTVVLEEGLKPYLLSITPEQSQFLQSREFSVTEVARWFNMPEFMVANSDPTYSNVGSFSLHFVTHNVRPRIRIYEQEFNWKLLTNYDDFYTQFNLDALLRADMKTRFESYDLAIRNRIYNPNECRAFEDKNRYQGGDIYENPNVLSKQDAKTN